MSKLPARTRVDATTGAERRNAAVGAALRSARARAGLSVLAVASQCEVSSSFLYDVERGARALPERVLERLTKVPALDLAEVRVARAAAPVRFAESDAMVAGGPR